MARYRGLTPDNTLRSTAITLDDLDTPRAAVNILFGGSPIYLW